MLVRFRVEIPWKIVKERAPGWDPSEQGFEMSMDSATWFAEPAQPEQLEIARRIYGAPSVEALGELGVAFLVEPRSE